MDLAQSDPILVHFAIIFRGHIISSKPWIHWVFQPLKLGTFKATLWKSNEWRWRIREIEWETVQAWTSSCDISVLTLLCYDISASLLHVNTASQLYSFQWQMRERWEHQPHLRQRTEKPRCQTWSLSHLVPLCVFGRVRHWREEGWRRDGAAVWAKRSNESCKPQAEIELE